MKCVDQKLTGQNIRNRMKEKNISVSEMQSACGFGTAQAIYKWFRGTTLPTIDNIIIVADLLDCTIDDLIITK